MRTALGAALVSLVLSVVALSESRIGVPINIAILATLMVLQGAGHL